MRQRAAGRIDTLAALLLAALLVTTGTDHFLSPSGFEAIVPGFLGSPAFWVRISGVAELACAVTIALPSTRRVGAIAAAILFVVVFPANVKMALDSHWGAASWTDTPVVAWLRLPIQIPLILWALFVARSTRTGRTTSAGRTR